MTNPSRREVWKMFDSISRKYDRVNRIISFGMDMRWRNKLAKFLPSKPKLKILDLATGTADQAVAFFKHSSSIESITGVDLSAKMLEIAKRKVPQMKTVLANVEKLPFANESFDAASFSFGIRNVENPLKALEEIARVLKPKGRCLILEFSMPPKPIRGFYLFYLRHILPRIAALICKNFDAYRYLNQTIESFPSGNEFCLMMKAAGFYRIQAIPMNLHSVTLYIGDRA